MRGGRLREKAPRKPGYASLAWKNYGRNIKPFWETRGLPYIG